VFRFGNTNKKLNKKRWKVLDEIDLMKLQLEAAWRFIFDLYHFRLINEAKCKECGNQNPKLSKVCEKCGSLIKETNVLEDWRKSIFDIIDTFDKMPDSMKKIYKLNFLKDFNEWKSKNFVN